MTHETFDLTDELLSAYIDGELDSNTRVRVEHALAADAGARVRLERMRAADAVLRKEFTLHVEPDDALANAVMHGSALPGRTKPRRNVWPIVGALAAGLGGVVIGTMNADRTPNEDSFAQINPILERALNTATSGAQPTTNDRSAQIVLTFQAQDGRYCRVFRWRETAHDAEGVACRDSGAWRIKAWDGTVASSRQFQAAGASELIDTAMDRLGGGAALDADRETALIKQDWE